MRLSILWRIMEISEGVIRRGRNTLLDLHNSSYDTKAKLQNDGGATNPAGLHPGILLWKCKSNPIPPSGA